MPNPNDIAHDAAKIADIVMNTATELRGDLFHSVYVILRIRAQYFTAMLFEEAAERYGPSKA